MQNKSRVLFGITTFSHTELGLQEMYGLRELGFTCDSFEYGARKKYTSTIARAYIILLNSLKLLVKSYAFNPDFIYLNSRIDFKGSVRDFITILIIKIFYFKRVIFLIKTHGSDLEVLQTRKTFYRTIVFPYLKRRVNAWLFLSKEELNWVVSYNLLASNKVFITKNIVRSDIFQTDPEFRKNHHIPDDHKILFFAGRMIRQKGIHDVVEAFESFRKKYKSILIMVGDGEEFEMVKEKIKELGIEQLVVLPGWISEEKVAYFTANSQVLIFPTYFPEGFPMALFNAVGAGLAILTTPTRAALDYLKEPDNCLWVEPKSAGSIESALVRLFDHPAMICDMHKNNKLLAEQFSRIQVATELSEILALLRTIPA